MAYSAIFIIETDLFIPSLLIAFETIISYLKKITRIIIYRS